MLRLVRTFTALAALNVAQAQQSIKTEFKSLQLVFQNNENCTAKSEGAVKIPDVFAQTTCKRKPQQPEAPLFDCPALENPISLYFMIDSSDSVTSENWKNMLSFIHHVVTDSLFSQKIEAKQDKIFVMVAQFSTYTQVEWADYYSDDEETERNFKNMLE